MNTAEQRYAPLRGRIVAIHSSMVVARIEVATDFGIIAATVSGRELDELGLAVGADVLAQIVGNDVLLALA